MILFWFFTLCFSGIFIERMELWFMTPVDFVAVLIIVFLHTVKIAF